MKAKIRKLLIFLEETRSEMGKRSNRRPGGRLRLR